jgi:hypothetical protein
MTTRQLHSIDASGSTAASPRNLDSRRPSFSESGRGSESDGRPTKRQRLDSSSTTSALLHRRSISPIPNDSNQDANIPDIITSLEAPLIDVFDGYFADADDDDSIDDDADQDGQEDNQSDMLRFRSPRSDFGGRRSTIGRAFTPTASLADSLLPGTPYHDNFDDLGSDLDLQQMGRRLPGRRRAPNSDSHLEASLRRQLQLRIGHRALSKGLKPILLELVSRGTEQLDRHRDEVDYWVLERELILELRLYLEIRLEILEAQLQVSTEYHDQQLHLEAEYLQSKYKVSAAYSVFIGQTKYRLELCGRPPGCILCPT